MSALKKKKIFKKVFLYTAQTNYFQIPSVMDLNDEKQSDTGNECSHF